LLTIYPTKSKFIDAITQNFTVYVQSACTNHPSKNLTIKGFNFARLSRDFAIIPEIAEK
jgi:hypothetical protein